MTAPRLHIYYGVEDPPLDHPARRGGAVVLQSYHPAVRERRLAALFPRTTVYLYYNPARVHPSELAAEPTLQTLDDALDGHGNLRLDPRRPGTHRFLLGRARELGATDGVQGLFVDDLDTFALDPSVEEAGRDLLAAVASAAPASRFVINRGFPFWSDAARLDAVVLENVTPRLVAAWPDQDVEWLGATLGPAVASLAARGSSLPLVFGLQYRDDLRAVEGAAPTSDGSGALASWLAATLDGVETAVDRRLAAWV